MIPKDEIPTTGGDAVIEAISRISAYREICAGDGVAAFVWSSNAAEQIEAALDEIGFEIRRK